MQNFHETIQERKRRVNWIAENPWMDQRRRGRMDRRRCSFCHRRNLELVTSSLKWFLGWNLNDGFEDCYECCVSQFFDGLKEDDWWGIYTNYRRKRVFARKFENRLAISAPNVVESSRFCSISEMKRTFWISHEITIEWAGLWSPCNLNWAKR
jgi:hypothetical protein